MIFCRGIPGLVPPPTERIIPLPSLGAAFEDFERRLFHFVDRAAHADFQRVDVAHQAHAIANALFDFADVFLLAPVQDVEAGVRQMIEARIDFGIVVIELDPILRERIADALEIRVGEFHGSALR